MNPWIEVAPEDYEAHMTSPAVAQLGVLADILARDLAKLHPRSLLVVGCATGNGLQHVDPAVTPRLTGVDVNPEFLAVARGRYAGRLPGLELVQGDILDPALEPGAFELVHAALIFEHVPWQAALRRVAGWVAPGGILSVELQLPSDQVAAVSPTAIASRYPDIARDMRLIDTDEFASLARQLGLRAQTSERIPLPQGKAFLASRFAREDRPAREGRPAPAGPSVALVVRLEPVHHVPDLTAVGLEGEILTRPGQVGLEPGQSFGQAAGVGGQLVVLSRVDDEPDGLAVPCQGVRQLLTLRHQHVGVGRAVLEEKRGIDAFRPARGGAALVRVPIRGGRGAEHAADV